MGGIFDRVGGWLEDRLRDLDVDVSVRDGRITGVQAGAGAPPTFMRDIAVGVAVGLLIATLTRKG